jgi:hypothetical protein
MHKLDLKSFISSSFIDGGDLFSVQHVPSNGSEYSFCGCSTARSYSVWSYLNIELDEKSIRKAILQRNAHITV